MQLHKGYGISNSVRNGVSTRTRFRAKRYERKIHEDVFKTRGMTDVGNKLTEAMGRYQHLLD